MSTQRETLRVVSPMGETRGARPQSLDNGVSTRPMPTKGADMKQEQAENLQAQIDALRMLVFALVAASPNVEAVAANAVMRLEVWRDVNEQEAVTDSYLQLIEDELSKMRASLGTLVEQHGHTEPPPP